jgi:hypothetical protein
MRHLAVWPIVALAAAPVALAGISSQGRVAHGAALAAERVSVGAGTLTARLAGLPTVTIPRCAAGPC